MALLTVALAAATFAAGQVAEQTVGSPAGSQAAAAITPGGVAPVPGGHPVAGAVDTSSLPGVDLDSLDPRPVDQWGVVGMASQSGGVESMVWDMAEIGGRLFVGGAYTGVQENGGAGTPVQNQRFLAAFDRDSGRWIETFRPTFNRPVYALAVSTTGKLIVGGEFTQVNGVNRKGLVALDPVTGEIDHSFVATIDGTTPIVRELQRDGDQLYVAGVFSRVYGTPQQPWIWNAARVSSATGRLDWAWNPKFMGGVWDLTIDPVRDRVVAVGSFTSVDGQANTAYLGSVTRSTGAVVGGLQRWVFNRTNEHQRQVVAVSYANHRIYAAGEQHSLQVLDATTHARLGYNSTGIACNTFSIDGCSFFAGGAYQVTEATADGKVIAGCHCNEPYTGPRDWWSRGTHYNSFDNSRADLWAAIAYRASDSKVASNFVPQLRRTEHETWNIFVDSRGCYYVGGYYRARWDGSWLGGFGRMCQPVKAPPAATAAVSGATAQVSWTAPDSQLPIEYFKVYRNGTFVADVTGTSSQVPTGGLATPQFTIRSRDVSGRLSPPVTATLQQGVVDDQPPTVPNGVTAVAAGNDVMVNWQASTDLPEPGGVGVAGYFVVRDWTTQWRVPADQLWFTDRGVTNGNHRYQVFAVDAGSRLSAGSTAATVNVAPIVDTQAPVPPTGVAATANGSQVTVSWNATTDLPDPGGVGVAGYYVIRDWTTQWLVPAGQLTFTDPSAPVGRRRYEVRAVDRGNRISGPSNLAFVQVG